MKNVNHNDPITRQVEVSDKDRGSELSPMSPPEAYAPPNNIKIEYDDHHTALKCLIDDHVEIKKNILGFENVLTKLQKNSELSIELNNDVLSFFNVFLQDFVAHNKKEEKYLFPILEKRFLEVGEHSKSKNPITPINVLEDEHTEATQLANEAHYVWILVFKVSDPATKRLLLKEFLLKSLKLVDQMRLHIFREDDIVFSLAQKHLTAQELDCIFLNF